VTENDLAPSSDYEVAHALPSEEFVQLFTKSQRRVFLYILAQVSNPVEAEEILQETNMVIWNKCRTFEVGTNFLAWACRIASYEVLKYRDRQRRDKLVFSDEFIEQIAEEAVENSDELERRRLALMQCLSKLKPKDRELIQQRYARGENGKSVAKVLGRPVNSIYQSLGRIRRSLFECINRRLAAKAGP
jgi:RNA polymerase sigma-70 factor, ECF subfamily